MKEHSTLSILERYLPTIPLGLLRDLTVDRDTARKEGYEACREDALKVIKEPAGYVSINLQLGLAAKVEDLRPGDPA